MLNYTLDYMKRSQASWKPTHQTRFGKPLEDGGASAFADGRVVQGVIFECDRSSDGDAVRECGNLYLNVRVCVSV